MKRTIYNLFICSLIFVGVTACDSKDYDPKIEHAQTILAYLIADNSINSELYYNISAFEDGMKKVTIPGSTLVVYWDGYDNNTFTSPTLFKYTVDGKGNLSNRAILKTYDEQDSTSEAVMLEVLNDTRNYCPADNYSLIFGSHGSSWLPAKKTSRALGDDYGYAINIPNLADVLSKSSMYFDFILMDLCMMSTVEVAYELRNTADYLVMSPTEIISYGFPYVDIMSLLFQRENKEKALIQVAQKFINYYDQASDRWGTMAVVKTSEMNGLAAEVSSIMEKFTENSKFNTSGLQQYGRSDFNNAIFDFEAFIRRLTKDNIPASFSQQLNKAVVYKDFVDSKLGTLKIDENSYSGLGCYILNASPYTNWNSYYKQLQWYKAAGINKATW